MNVIDMVMLIKKQIAAIQRKYPERFRRDSSRALMPGTYITVRADWVIWIGDHYAEDWWLNNQLTGSYPDVDLERVARALDNAMDVMGVRA